MKSFIAVSSLIGSIIILSFFVVFAFHAHTPLQEDVKEYLETGQEELPFSQEANSHMHDVFVLISWARILAVISIVTALVSLKNLNKRSLQGASVVLITTPLLLALVNWNTLFTAFHQVFFPQGNWMFPANSLLIQTYPIESFVQYATAFGLLVILSGILLAVLSRTLPASVLGQEVLDR